MVRAPFVVVFVVAQALVSAVGWAAICTHSSGTLFFAAVGVGGTNIGSCTPAQPGDEIRLTGGDVVITSTMAAPIAMTTGSITTDGANVRMGAGNKITFSGAGFLNTKGGTFEASGHVVYTGRLTAEPTWSEGAGTETATLTIEGTAGSWAPSTNTGIWVRFVPDDPTDPTEAVTQPVLVGAVPPERGKYRWSAAKWTYWPITAVSGSTITISTDAWGDQEGGGGSADAYNGTRGQALSSPVALVSATPQPHGFDSIVRIDPADLDLTLNGDLTDQWLEFTSGPCTGYRTKIEDVRVQTTPTPDDIYVAGDVSRCVAGGMPNVLINYGFRKHDRIEVVAMPEIDFGNAATLRHTGGIQRITRAQIQHLGAFLATGVSPALTSHCNFCVYQESATVQPTAKGSVFSDNDVSFANTASPAGDTGTVSVQSSTGVGAGFRFPSAGPMDLTGYLFDRNFIRDQWNNTTGNGTHALRWEAVKGFSPRWTRCERVSDDCAFGNSQSYGTGVSTTMTARHLIALAGSPSGASNNSSQGWNAAVGVYETDDAVQEAEYRLNDANLIDAIITGIEDGSVQFNDLGSTLGRLAVLSANIVGANGIPGNTGIAQALMSTIPNKLLDSIYLARGSATFGNPFMLRGVAENSIIGGYSHRTGSNNEIRDTVTMKNTFADLSQASGSSASMLRRSSSEPWAIFPLFTGTSSAILMGANGNGGQNLCDDFDTPDAGTRLFSSIRLRRMFLGFRNSTQSSGIMQGCNSNDLNGEMVVEVDGLTVAVDNGGASGQSFGCGYAPGVLCAGTDQGARLKNVRFENRQVARTSGNAFGANAPASAVHVPSMGPDVSDTHARLSAFVDPSRVDMPSVLGISQLGTEQAMMGDLFLSQLENFSTHEEFLRVVATGGGGGSLTPPTLYPGN